MQSWSGGYVADVEYTGGYHSELSPSLLHAAAMLNGFEPAPLPEKYTYCELGCGAGHTLCVLAAANPQAEFYGVDFLPGHVVAGRQLAEDGGLRNVQFIENSFQELAEAPPADLPQFDVIALHGVYSWVSEENRRAIGRFIRSHLKTGGIAYVSYNCLPGWTLGIPLQRMLLEFSRLHHGRSDIRIRHAFDLVNRLAQTDASIVRDNPSFKMIKNHADRDMFNYLAHEYINEHWHPMYFADVAAELADAKVRFVASAGLVENFQDLTVSEEQAAILNEIEDPILRETVRDYCYIKKFRRDIFVRGARKLSRGRQEELLRRVRLCLVVPGDKVSRTVKVPKGEATLGERAYVPMFEALADGPREVGELLQIPAVRDDTDVQAPEAVGMLAGSGQVVITPAKDQLADNAAVQRLNRAIAERSWYHDTRVREALAAPQLGAGLSTDIVERLLYLALTTGVAAEPEPLASFVIEPVLARGEDFMEDGEPIKDEEKRRAHVIEKMNEFLTARLPVWKRLEIM